MIENPVFLAPAPAEPEAPAVPVIEPWLVPERLPSTEEPTIPEPIPIVAPGELPERCPCTCSN